MHNKKYYPALLASLLLIGSCVKYKEPEKRGVFVSTTGVTNITLDAATNKVSVSTGGDADLVGAESISERGVVWATTEKPTTANNKIPAGSGTGNFKTDITGLTFASTVHVRAYVISNGKEYYGNDIEFVASVPVELIKNGDFSKPAAAITSISDLEDWKSEETDGGIIGRDHKTYWGYPYFFWTYSTSKSVYQVVGTVPALRSDYAIKFDGNYDWTDWGAGYDGTIGIIFSVYSGSDPKTRVAIDTVEIKTGAFPDYGNNWKKYMGTFSIPAGSPHAGKNLVIEIDMLPYIDPSNGQEWDDTIWFDFDNFSVIQTIR